MEDTLYEILRWLPIRDILNCKLVCKLFNKVCCNQMLWVEKVGKVIQFNGSYYEAFKFNYGLEKVVECIGYGGEIEKLYEESKLDLGYKKLTSLPTELGLLQNLKVLWVSNNQLTTLPTELGLLQNLQVLSVSSNQLTTLPTELGLLQNLQELYVYDNQLTTLPKEIKNMKIELVY